MLAEILVVEWAHHSACAQVQAYCPCEPEMKIGADYCRTLQVPLNQSQGSPARKIDGQFRLDHLKGSYPLYAAKLD